VGTLHLDAQLGGLAHGLKDGLKVKGWHMAFSNQRSAKTSATLLPER
jgi:hypothetical protein